MVNSSKNILFISPSLPPIHCGIGDYTYSLIKNLSKNKSYNLAVVTDVKAETNQLISNVKTYPEMNRWKWDDLKLLKKLLVQLKKNECVIPTLKSYDSTKLKHNKNIYNINRNYLHFVQTPQAFNYKSILSLQKNITSKTTDDSSLFISAGKKVKFINGEYKNNKITLKSDTKENKTINFGIGFDIHRLVKKKKLYLGGLKIPYHSGLKGHSDGDVIIHALIDSLLGSCKLKDIGTLFSDKNVKYKNIRSSKMLKKVLILIKKKGFYINNMDINIIAEKPKIGHYRKKIIKSLSKLCDINEELINIKGKTTEKLGLIGKEKAIACEVISSVFKYV